MTDTTKLLCFMIVKSEQCVCVCVGVSAWLCVATAAYDECVLKMKIDCLLHITGEKFTLRERKAGNLKEVCDGQLRVPKKVQEKQKRKRHKDESKMVTG